MRRVPQRPVSKGMILRIVLIFLGCYFLSLMLWVQIKDHYGYTVTYAASKLVTLVKDVRFEGLKKEKGHIQVTFSPVRSMSPLLINIRLGDADSYTYNTPLTLAILAALFPFVKRKRRAYGQGFLMLIGVHLLLVFSLEAHILTGTLIGRGLEPANNLRVFAYHFLSRFTEIMIIRFEPFLIGVYVFFKFKR